MALGHLTPAQRDQLIAEAAATLQQWGGSPLADAARWLLPAAGPLTWLAGQALWLAQPALSGWLDPARLTDWALLLEEPDIGERLTAVVSGQCSVASNSSELTTDHRN